MFLKQFRVKSNVRMKSSDRKKLRGLIETRYVHLSPEEVSLLCPLKEDIIQLKLTCHGGAAVTAYLIGNDPMLFELIGERLFPTVYALWRVPSLLPHITTWTNVFERLAGGADLMAPGIVRSCLDGAKTGDPVAIRLTSSGDSAVAVGSLLVDPVDLLGPDRKGKAVAVTHVYGDMLWAHGSKTTLPKATEAEDSDEGEEVEGDGSKEEGEGEDEVAELEKETTGEDAAAQQTDDVVEEEDMDALLEACVMSALSRKPKLPMLTSTFYSGHVLPSVPPGRTLDIKKTAHKKLTPYLAQLQREGLLEVKELSPGVQSIVSVNAGHPLLRGANILPLVVNAPEETGPRYTFPTVREMRTVTAAVLPLFRGYSKGHPLSIEEVRNIVKSYVKANDVRLTADRRSVVLDPVLTDVATTRDNRPETLAWEELFQKILSRMQYAHEITFPGEKPQVRKGALEPITVSVAQRTGNKKVTLVEGLETYGIDPHQLAHEVQVGVAASTAVNPAARGGQQVLVQGNQVLFLERLLTGPAYGVHRKYIKGLENAPKKKKK
ncbi:eukaryotic translation initiation factor 2D-like [Ornithodoros turicata]|uniref:eukaryotic translation initiation factor 2D-like n=1 Tax=Ornithodoros turicata TaxID=34597 RepID=UPI003138B290